MKIINANKVDPSIKENLKVLVNTNLDFCVDGSLICQYYLKDHARYTKDIDIVISNDIQEVEEEFKRAFGIIDFTHSKETDKFYEPYFTCYTKLNGLRGQIEGKIINFLPDVKVEEYSYEGITFKGTRVEFVIAEKLVALLSELPRPYKHLVDIYSFSKIDQSLFDKEEIKRYMLLINKQENKYRNSIGLKDYTFPTQIPSNKVLNPPCLVPTFQGKHNLTREEMIFQANKWLKTFL